MKAITLYIINTEEEHTFLIYASSPQKALKAIKERGFEPLGYDTKILFSNEAIDIENLFL